MMALIVATIPGQNRWQSDHCCSCCCCVVVVIVYCLDIIGRKEWRIRIDSNVRSTYIVLYVQYYTTINWVLAVSFSAQASTVNNKLNCADKWEHAHTNYYFKSWIYLAIFSFLNFSTHNFSLKIKQKQLKTNIIRKKQIEKLKTNIIRKKQIYSVKSKKWGSTDLIP